MRILIAEDDFNSAEMLRDFLSFHGYDVETAENGEIAFEKILEGDFRIVISDWEMPKMTGIELCRRIRSRSLSGYVFIFLLTSHGSHQHLVRGIDAGADDFLTKPFRPEELLARLRAAERIVALESRDLFIFSMAKLAESRDLETGEHLERMREYSQLLAMSLSKQEEFASVIDGDYIRTLYLTSPLHDIGKVAIPDYILLKPGKLTTEEFEIMKTHTTIGKDTLESAIAAQPNAEYLRFASDIAWSHHERFDGRGYPRMLEGEEIPLCGRIVALADVYDALTSKRIYKPAFSHQEAKRIMFEEMDGAFDPRIVKAFMASEEDFQRVKFELQPNSVEDHLPECDFQTPVMATNS